MIGTHIMLYAAALKVFYGALKTLKKEPARLRGLFFITLSCA